MNELDIDKLQAICLSGAQTRDHDGVVLPPNYSLASLEKALEPYREFPSRHKGTFSTHLTDEFCKYVAQHARDGSRLFLDPEKLRSVCRINHGTEDNPEWGDLKAVVTLRQTPEYSALVLLCAGLLNQDTLVDYIVDWAPLLSFSTAEIAQATGSEQSELTLPAAIAAIRNLKVQTATASEHKQTDTDRERSLFEQAAVTSDPPRTMGVRLIPYEGLGERVINVRLIYRPTSPPTIKAMIVGSGALETAIAMEFRALLTETLGASTGQKEGKPALNLGDLVHIGTFG